MWYDTYLHKPWAAVPNPPHSYTCGELVRQVYQNIHNIHSPEIVANPACLLSCMRNMRDFGQNFSLRLLKPHEAPKEFDVVYLCQAEHADHVGIYTYTVEGAAILHCAQNCGVILDSIFQIRNSGFKNLVFTRHKELEHA